MPVIYEKPKETPKSKESDEENKSNGTASRIT
jgi:hypothetical protein